MKKVCVLIVVITLLALALGCTANTREMKGKTSLELDFGYSAFVFNGIGEWYDGWGEFLERAGWTVVENRPPNQAIPYGVKFKYGLSPKLSVIGSAGAFSSTGRFTASIDWPADWIIDTTISATFFGAGVHVVLVDPPHYNIFAEVEALSWAVTYDESFQETGETTVDKREAGGNKIGGALAIGGEYFLPNKSISLIGKIVYRVGKLEQIATRRDDLGNSGVGEPLQTIDPATFDYKDMQIDLGGWGVSFGLCFPIFS
ncbi:hypothetical protein LCGC14_1491620 [marine sediment metagenome]|uniref:Outer membrane protein beta-barrel domain-containing protein n=1 Tax=marine sediment metagenome TaxID=412755 RepID=A0A0F9J7A3_9ZZZZ